MIASFSYIVAMVAANLSVAHFGPWVSPINAFLFIGLDLSLRDYLHESWKRRGLWPKMGALIGVSGIISYALNPASGHIAIASVTAFIVAAVADSAIYHAMRAKPYLVRSNASNVAGAAVDSLIFPTIAFGGLLPAIVAMQFAAKVGGGALWSILLRSRIAARPNI